MFKKSLTCVILVFPASGACRTNVALTDRDQGQWKGASYCGFFFLQTKLCKWCCQFDDCKGWSHVNICVHMAVFCEFLALAFSLSLCPHKHLFHGLLSHVKRCGQGKWGGGGGRPTKFIIRWTKGGKEVFEIVCFQCQNLSAFTKCSLIWLIFHDDFLPYRIMPKINAV